jgi:ABC-2 type transport system permease protein
MSGKTFTAMLARDAHVARRNSLQLLLQVMLQPMLFVFVFGRVLTRSGFMNSSYKSLLIPGVMAMSMAMTGIQTVAMPLIAEFQFTREIEDRLLAPMNIGWLAVEKVIAGMIQAMVAGLVVLPAAWLLIGSAGVELTISRPLVLAGTMLLVALMAGTAGLTLGCSVGQTQIGLVFTLVLAPMIFFGCIYYPWSALAPFPILQKAVLINPLVYAGEGLRAALAPQFPHLGIPVVMGVLLAFDAGLFLLGLSRFRGKAIS